MSPAGSGNTLSERMDCQEHAFSNLIDRLGKLLAGYNMLQYLRELKANFTTMKNHVSTLSGMDVMAMVDTGPTYNFVTGREVRRQNLDLKKNGYHIKAVNSKAQSVLDLATVQLTLGPSSS
ncbi:hypothetical protein ACH5RR_003037 [Cinchona calisaya]|uniref:Uncharacterized protein n=1 Tax=Cinchona calisaya TaxID=153742 RepID=A0ABD3AU20_9GENT